MKEDDTKEEMDKLRADIAQWKEKYRGKNDDYKESQEEVDRLTRELKNSAGASQGELRRLKDKVNQLELENQNLTDDLQDTKNYKEELREDM